MQEETHDRRRGIASPPTPQLGRRHIICGIGVVTGCGENSIDGSIDSHGTFLAFSLWRCIRPQIFVKYAANGDDIVGMRAEICRPLFVESTSLVRYLTDLPVIPCRHNKKDIEIF